MLRECRRLGSARADDSSGLWLADEPPSRPAAQGPGQRPKPSIRAAFPHAGAARLSQAEDARSLVSYRLNEGALTLTPNPNPNPNPKP